MKWLRFEAEVDATERRNIFTQTDERIFIDIIPWLKLTKEWRIILKGII